MLDNYLGMSYGSAGPEFNVNELIIYTKQGVFKAETDIKACIDQLSKCCKQEVLQEPNPEFMFVNIISTQRDNI